MSQFRLFIYYGIFSLITHFCVQFIISRVENKDGTEDEMPAKLQILACTLTIGCYLFAIWSFCGWIVRQF